MNDLTRPAEPAPVPMGEAPAAPPPAPAPAPSAAAADPAPSKPPYPPPAEVPTQSGPRGIRFDFNAGARVTLPAGKWHVRLSDLDTGNILFERDLTGGGFMSTKRFYVRFRISVWEEGKLVYEHDYDARDKEVLIQFPIGTLGDTLAWLPYAVRFQEVHGCKLTLAMSDLIIPLLRDAYPTIRFVTHEALVEEGIRERCYATYCLGLFFDDAENVWQPTDFRHVGLHKTAAYILGVSDREEPPRFVLPDESRPIPEPYVCIAVQASTQAKKWNNPHGWREVIRFLKARGFRVICIDKEAAHGAGIAWTQIPHGAEDETGEKPLVERARWLRHAAAFIGTSSGLAWLAWGAGCPVVLVSGFTHPTNEFETPYRIINWHACNSCWNDPRHRFNHKDFLYCPRHAGTDRQFECTRLIQGQQVIAALGRVPEVAAAG